MMKAGTMDKAMLTLPPPMGAIIDGAEAQAILAPEGPGKIAGDKRADGMHFALTGVATIGPRRPWKRYKMNQAPRQGRGRRRTNAKTHRLRRPCRDAITRGLDDPGPARGRRSRA
jgi:hypothetical protein